MPPILLQLAAGDLTLPPPARSRIEEALEPLPQAEVEVHAEAGHGFARRYSALFELGVAERAARYIEDFLSSHLC